MGIYYDDPTMTPPPLQRADVCIPVDREIDAADDVRCIRFPGGPHAVASYVGRVSELLSAYRGLADEVRRSGEFEFRDGPALMFLREANVGGIAGVHHLEAGFPVARRR
jgi:DNA gyrase inhibitor GyrI